MVAGRRIDERVVNDLLGRVVLVIAHNADFDRRFLEKRVPVFAEKHWACSPFGYWLEAEGIRSSALEFVAYSSASVLALIAVATRLGQAPVDLGHTLTTAHQC
jgi:DNA polymerase-3 subunit epsilon